MSERYPVPEKGKAKAVSPPLEILSSGEEAEVSQHLFLMAMDLANSLSKNAEESGSGSSGEESAADNAGSEEAGAIAAVSDHSASRPCCAT
jgi:hypothetical protein